MFLCLLLVLSFAACDQTEEAAPDAEVAETGATAGEKEIVVILKNLSTTSAMDMRDGAEATAKEMRVNVTVQVPMKMDNLEEQMNLVRGDITSGVDSIALLPVDAYGIVPAV